MDFKVNRTFLKRTIFALPFLACFFIQLSKISGDIVSFSEVWWILSPFRFSETMQGGHTPFYYCLVRLFKFFNLFGITPYVYLRFINCLFNIAALAYIYKTFKEIFNYKIAFLTILCLGLGSFFLGATLTTIRYPLVNFLFFFSLYNFLIYLRIRSNRYFWLFFLAELIVISIDTHVAFCFLFQMFYISLYRIRVDRKIVAAAILLGINFIAINTSIYFFAKPFIQSHIGWLASKNNPSYFLDEFIPNFFFNTLVFKTRWIAGAALGILFFLFVCISRKASDKRVRVVVFFLASCFLLLGLAQYAAKLQFFIVKYFIFLIPFMLSLFFYVMPGPREIGACLFCAFVGFSTVIAYPMIGASKYTPIFRAIEEYKPTTCLSLNLYGSGFVQETLLKSLYPSIKIEQIEAVRSDIFYPEKILLLASSYKTADFNIRQNEILSAVLLGHAKVLDYYFEYCPGYTSVYSIYVRTD